MFITVLVISLSLLTLMAMLLAVMIAAANRRHRHRAEMAELQLRRDTELRAAEREATQHTLTEVGRELHDNIGQLLIVTQVGLLDHLSADAVNHPRVDAALHALEEAMEEVRRLGRSLNQDNWQRRRLSEALEQEGARLERLGRARVVMEVEHAGTDPSPEVKTILFRAVQEVVANALRHSGARTITLRSTGDPPTLVVADDGRGFDPTAPRSGSGLDNIMHRCALVGYAAVLDTAPGRGCTWTFNPLHDHGA